MVFMKEIAQQALSTGYLSIAAQNQMQLLLQSNYDSDDLDAFIILQRAVVAGDVKQESRTQKNTLASTGKDAAANIKLAYQIAAEMAFAAAIALTIPNSSKDHPSLGA
jgi:metal-dependent amidase/aminoacylase/carboxypeptidase family protein